MFCLVLQNNDKLSQNNDISKDNDNDLNTQNNDIVLQKKKNVSPGAYNFVMVGLSHNIEKAPHYLEM